MTDIRLTCVERPFVDRFICGARSGSNLQGAIMFERDGVAAVTYYAALSLLASLIGGTVVVGAALLTASGIFGGRNSLIWAACLIGLILVLLLCWFDLRFAQYLRARRRFRADTSNG